MQTHVGQSPLSCIVFSADDPLQLEATLRSCRTRLVCGQQPVPVQVFYTASTSLIRALYRRVGIEHPGVVFHDGEEPLEELSKLLRNHQCVLFLQAGEILMRRWDPHRALSLLERDRGVVGCMGRSPDPSGSVDEVQSVGVDLRSGPPVRCPELTSCIYRSSDLLPLLASPAYDEPRPPVEALAARLPSLLAVRSRIAWCDPAPLVTLSQLWNSAPSQQGVRPDVADQRQLAEAFADGFRFQLPDEGSSGMDQAIPVLSPPASARPAVSVIITSLDASPNPEAVLTALLRQSLSDWECIIVLPPEGSTARSVAESFSRNHPHRLIAMLDLPESSPAEALDGAAGVSSGRYILPLPGGWILAAGALERLAGEFDLASEISMVCADEGPGLQSSFEPGRGNAAPGSGPTIGLPLTMFRREVWSRVGGYVGTPGGSPEVSEFEARCRSAGVSVRWIPEALTIAGHGAGAGGVVSAPAPLVSVIIPTLNRGAQLEVAVRSVLNQTLQDLEVVVVNDGGQSAAWVTRLDPRVIYIDHERNQGMAAARNTGILASRGRYIAYLDDDDRFYPSHLAIAMGCLERQGLDVVYTDACRVWERTIDGELVVIHRDRPYSVDFDPQAILFTNFIPTLCIVHSRRCLDLVGLFDTSLRRTEDWELWIRISRQFLFHHIPEITCEFSWREDGTSTTSLGRLGFDWAEIAIYARHRHWLKPDPEAQARYAAQIRGALERLREALQAGLERGTRDVSRQFRGGEPSELISRLEEYVGVLPDFAALLLEVATLIALEAGDEASLGRLRHSMGSLDSGLAGSGRGSGAPGMTEASPAVPAVSVIVPLYNAVAFTRQMIESFFATTVGASVELILVDNASTDGTREFLATLPAGVTLILNEQNRNFSGACNQGARAARGELLLFLNSDTVLSPGWLEPMMSLMAQDPQVGIVANKHLYPYTNTVHHAGIAFSDDPPRNSHYLVGVVSDDPRVNVMRECQAVNGACLLVRRELFERMHGFDEAYRNGCEDVELCLQVRRAGYRVVYCPTSVIYHYGQRSPGRNANDDPNMALLASRWRGAVSSDLRAFAALDRVTVASARARAGVAIGVVAPGEQLHPLAAYTEELISALRGATAGADTTAVIALAERTKAGAEADSAHVVRCWARGDRNPAGMLMAAEEHDLSWLFVPCWVDLTDQLDLPALLRGCRERGIRTGLIIQPGCDVEHLLPLLAGADRIMTHDTGIHALMRAGGVSAERLLRLPQGVPSPCQPPLSQGRARELLRFSPGVRLITSFGCLDRSSGLREIIEVLPAIMAAQPTVFAFLGSPQAGDEDSLRYQAECQQLVERLGLASRVCIAPVPVPEQTVQEFLRASDAIVFNPCGPGHHYYALLKAAGLGRLVVTTAAPQCPELERCVRVVGHVRDIAAALPPCAEAPLPGAHLASVERLLAEHSLTRVAEVLVRLLSRESGEQRSADLCSAGVSAPKLSSQQLIEL